MCDDQSDRVFLTPAEAEARILDGDSVHTYAMSIGGALLGADWERSRLLAAFERAREIEESGPIAMGKGYGVTFVSHEGRRLFVASKP